MKGILLTPVRKIATHKTVLKCLKEEFVNLGHELNTDVMATSEHDMLKMGEADLTRLNKQIQRELKKADFVVAEVSEPSSGVGFLISQAVVEKKPVLVLKKNDSRRAPLPMQAAKSRLMNFHTYHSEKDISGIVKHFITHIRKLIDTKFILILSPDLDRYLEWTVSERRVHKAQVVRNSLRKTMSDDEEYQDILKDQIKNGLA